MISKDIPLVGEPAAIYSKLKELLKAKSLTAYNLVEWNDNIRFGTVNKLGAVGTIAVDPHEGNSLVIIRLEIGGLSKWLYPEGKIDKMFDEVIAEYKATV